MTTVVHHTDDRMYYRGLNEKHTILWSGIASDPEMKLSSEIRGKHHLLPFHTAYCFSRQLFFCCQVSPIYAQSSLLKEFPVMHLKLPPKDLPSYNICQYTLTRRGWELTKSVNQSEPVLMLSLICDQR